MLKQENRDRNFQKQQNINTSSEITNTENDGEVRAANGEEPSSSIDTSPSKSPVKGNYYDNKGERRDQRYPDEKHKNNPLFRSDAFD